MTEQEQLEWALKESLSITEDTHPTKVNEPANKDKSDKIEQQVVDQKAAIDESEEVNDANESEKKEEIEKKEEPKEKEIKNQEKESSKDVFDFLSNIDMKK